MLSTTVQHSRAVGVQYSLPAFFFSTFGEGSQIEVAEVFFQAPSAVVAGGGDAGGRGALSDSHGQRQRRSVLIRDWKTVA